MRLGVVSRHARSARRTDRGRRSRRSPKRARREGRRSGEPRSCPVDAGVERIEDGRPARLSANEAEGPAERNRMAARRAERERRRRRFDDRAVVETHSRERAISRDNRGPVAEGPAIVHRGRERVPPERPMGSAALDSAASLGGARPAAAVPSRACHVGRHARPDRRDVARTRRRLPPRPPSPAARRPPRSPRWIDRERDRPPRRPRVARRDETAKVGDRERAPPVRGGVPTDRG